MDGVAARLFNLGVTPLEIAPDAVDGATVQEFLQRLGAGRPSSADLVLFSRQMYSITKPGCRCCAAYAASPQSTTTPAARCPARRAAQPGIRPRSRPPLGAPSGDLLAAFVSMVRVGESTGTLDNSFQRLCEYLAHDQDVQDRVKAAVRYPLIVVGVIGLAVSVITVFVIPKFAPLFKILGDDIPWPTRVIMGTSDFVQHSRCRSRSRNDFRVLRFQAAHRHRLRALSLGPLQARIAGAR